MKRPQITDAFASLLQEIFVVVEVLNGLQCCWESQLDIDR